MIVRHFKTFQITRIHLIVQRVLACILQDTGHFEGPLASIPCSMPFRFLITGLDASSPSSVLPCGSSTMGMASAITYGNGTRTT